MCLGKCKDDILINSDGTLSVLSYDGEINLKLENPKQLVHDLIEALVLRKEHPYSKADSTNGGER